MLMSDTRLPDAEALIDATASGALKLALEWAEAEKAHPGSVDKQREAIEERQDEAQKADLDALADEFARLRLGVDLQTEILAQARRHGASRWVAMLAGASPRCPTPRPVLVVRPRGRSCPAGRRRRRPAGRRRASARSPDDPGGDGHHVGEAVAARRRPREVRRWSRRDAEQ